MTLIRLENVSKSYHSGEIETRALRNISLQIESGDFLAIEGPSGCGKSTLLSILGLLEDESEGAYILRGHTTKSLASVQKTQLRNREIGFVFQNFHLIPELSVSENIELPLKYARMPKSNRQLRVAEVLDLVQMAHRAKHHPSLLSGGEQQRVAVARAVAMNPSLLLADEPTGNLDSLSGKAVMSLLSDLNSNGTTVILVTHDHRFAKLANSHIELEDGHLQPSRSAVASIA